LKILDIRIIDRVIGLHETEIKNTHHMIIWSILPPRGQVSLPKDLKSDKSGKRGCEGSASTPISTGGVDDLRVLILRTLNDNQLLVLNAVADREQSLTSLLKQLSQEYQIPLSTLKLNARILRELNLISYGSIRDKRTAQLESLGSFILRLLLDDPCGATIQFAD
jgi:hypothetical protein